MLKWRPLAVLLVLMLALMPFSAMAQEEKPDLLGEFETTDINGESRDFNLIRDAKLTFVNIWATFCGPCIDEMPHLSELADEYAGKVQFIGIVGDVNIGYGVDESLIDLAKQIAEETGASNYTHLIPSDQMNERVLFSVRAYPTSFFVDSEGRQVGTAYEGSRGIDDWRAIIDEALAQAGS